MGEHYSGDRYEPSKNRGDRYGKYDDGHNQRILDDKGRYLPAGVDCSRESHYSSREREQGRNWEDEPRNRKGYHGSDEYPKSRNADDDYAEQKMANGQSQRRNKEPYSSAGKPNESIIFRGIDKEMTDLDVS